MLSHTLIHHRQRYSVINRIRHKIWLTYVEINVWLFSKSRFSLSRWKSLILCQSRSTWNFSFYAKQSCHKKGIRCPFDSNLMWTSCCKFSFFFFWIVGNPDFHFLNGYPLKLVRLSLIVLFFSFSLKARIVQTICNFKWIRTFVGWIHMKRIYVKIDN